MVSVVGVPIAFVGSGERLEDLEPFHADRFVSRMLGMGDVLSLIEKAEEVIDADAGRTAGAEDPQGRIHPRRFPRSAADAASKMGPLENILGMLPGMGSMKQLAEQKPDETAAAARRGDHQLDDARGAAHAEIIDGSRRKRIARGSGTAVEDVNRLLKQFDEMQRMLKMVGQMTGDPIAAPPKKKKKKGPFSLMK